MHKAIRHILTHCGGVSRGEVVFILYDAQTREIGEAFIEETRNLGVWASWLEYNEITNHGMEPSPYVAEIIRVADLTISLCQYSLAHSKARMRAKRFLSLPQYSWHVLNNPCVLADYEAQAPIVRRFADSLTEGSEIRVTTEAGTDITMRIDGRRGNYCPGFVRKPGDLGSPPDIEANIAPIEGTAQGCVVSDSPNSAFVVKDGMALWGIDNLKHTVLAECGIGLNPLAQLCGNMLIDEGVFGSVHFGFGCNHTIGGNNETDRHCDYVMKDASLWIDGRPMLIKGKLADV